MSSIDDTFQVLHVDDEPAFADLAATYLGRENDAITVRTATNAEEGLEVLADDDIECIISDYEMPGQNGIEFLETVREEFPDLPFILYTGKGSEAVASDAISAGVTDYLQKESGTDQYAVLANRVTNAVESYRSQQALDERTRDLQRYKHMINSMQEAACIYDEDGRFEVVNEYLADWYDTTRDALQGQQSNLIPAIREQADETDPYEALLDRRRGQLSGEVSGEFLDHGFAVIEYRLTPLLVDGAVDGVVGVARDVTERVERERELERYEAYLEESTDIITVLDESGTIKYQSPAVERVLGYEHDELVGQDGFEFIHPDDRDDVYATFTDLVSEPGATVAVECRFRTADDEWCWLEVRGTNQLDNEAIEGVVTNNRDITERKDRERRLRKTTSRLEALFEQSPDMINVHDEEGNIINPNPQLVEKTGYDEAELTDMKVWDIDQAIEPGEATSLWEGMDHGDQRRLEGVYRRRDGSTFPVEVHIRRLDLDGEDRFVVISRDVTERTERERNLRVIQRDTQRLMETKTAVETAEIGVDTAHEVLDAPLSGVHLLDDDGAVLEPAAFVDTVRDTLEDPPQYARDATDDPASTVVWDAFESGEVRYLDDVRTNEKLAAVTPVRSAIVHPLGDHGVFIVSATEPHAFDSTDKTLIEILASSLTVALDRVEREALLRQREQRLQEKNERLEEFASIVSHDLRNPLNVAHGRLELVEAECDSEHLDTIRQAHERMDALIADLLTLAREGESVADPAPLALADFVESCWQSVETGDATLVTDVDRSIRADESQFRRLIENVVRNAVEHGGDAVTITVGELDDGFSVADDGRGIPESDREDVFDAGYSTSDGGTGFGLSIVQQVAQAHGWTVRVTESAEGGARFEITGVEFVDT